MIYNPEFKLDEDQNGKLLLSVCENYIMKSEIKINIKEINMVIARLPTVNQRCSTVSRGNNYHG